MKRIQAAPQGRAHRIRKRSNHVTIIVDRMAPAETAAKTATPAAEAAPKAAPAKKTTAKKAADVKPENAEN